MKRSKLIFLFINICMLSCTKDQFNKQKNDAKPLLELASAYDEKQQTDSAFNYYDKAKNLAIIQNDSLTVGKSFLRLAIFSTNNGEDNNGQELSLNALKYLDKEKQEHFAEISSSYNNLGIATHNLRDYANAIKYYDSAIKYSKDLLDTNQYRNNKAYVYQETKQYRKALRIYDTILNTDSKNKIEYARALSNISYTKWILNPEYNASADLLKALNIRKSENDFWGQNSSYYYLADYYTKHQIDSALFYAHKMYEMAKKLKSNDDQLYALQKLIKLSPSPLNIQYFETYLKLDDSAQTLRNTAKNKFALIRYRVEESNTENLILQKDNTEKKYQIARREILFAITFLLLIAGSIIAVLWYKKRKQKLDLESENAIRENQLKTSKKVHDVVANKIYSVISEIENRKDLDKDHLLDKLEHIYHTSRDISYEITEPQEVKKFSQQLSDMFYTYISEPPFINITGNNDELWAAVANHNKGEVFIVLQELMTNMKKHSQATAVTVQFQQKDEFISISYQDNGIGLPKNVAHQNGLRNTETRIKNISGTLTFETTENTGLAILISFPAN